MLLYFVRTIRRLTVFRTKFENELMRFDINIIEFQTTLLSVLIVLNEKIKQHLRASIPGFITKDM